MSELTRIGSGIELETWYQGPDEGLPVLFIHGGYGGPVTTLLGRPPWFEDVFHANDPVRLVRYSRRNAGASTYVFDDFALADLAADAVGLLDALAIDRAVLVGSSAGGPVALELTLTWPERVIALCLPNTGAAIMSDRPEGFGDTIPPMVMSRVDEVVGRLAIVDDVMARGPEAAFADRVDEIRAGLFEAALIRADVLCCDPAPLVELAATASEAELRRQWHGAILNWAATAGHDFHGRLGEIAVETLIIHGDADEIVPFEFGAHLHAEIAASTFHRIPEATHEVTRDPRAVAVLRQWVLSL